MKALTSVRSGKPIPTLSDVAREAGVSLATASRVLSNAECRVPISEATRDRVRTAARTLGYRPNLTARSLSQRRTKTIGLIFPQGAITMHSAYHAAILAGIADVLTARAYSVALYFSDFGRTRTGPNFGRLLQDGRVDGGLILDSHVLAEPQLAALEREVDRVPFVMIGHRLPGRRLHWVAADDRGGAAAAVDHLITLGHRRIAHFANLRGHPAAERHAGYLDAMARHGLDVPPPWLITERPEHAVAALMHQPDRPTALLAWNDFTAMAAVRALRELALAVPGDVSVTGYDDFEVATLTWPALTTVRVPLHSLGALGAEALLDLLGDTPSSSPAPQAQVSQQVLPTALVVRESTGRLGPAAADRSG
jgi:LacI family transcriptional regulator